MLYSASYFSPLPLCSPSSVKYHSVTFLHKGLSCEMSGLLWAFLWIIYVISTYESLQKLTKFKVLFCTLKYVTFLFCFTQEYKGNGVYYWNYRGFQIFRCKLDTHASSRGPRSTTVTTILKALQQMKFTTMNYGFLCYSLRVQGTWHLGHLE